MANVLALPFRFMRAGKAAVVDQGSDEYYKQQLATLIMTYRGERFIYDGLGMPDMAFAGFQYSALATQVKEILPAISTLDITSSYLNDTTQQVTINFETSEETE